MLGSPVGPNFRVVDRSTAGPAQTAFKPVFVKKNNKYLLLKIVNKIIYLINLIATRGGYAVAR
jgi:hypothetical protein